MSTRTTTEGREVRVLKALAARPQGMTSGEISFLALHHVSTADRDEILNALKDAGMVLRGRPVNVGLGRLSTTWTITEKGRKHLEQAR